MNGSVINLRRRQAFILLSLLLFTAFCQFSCKVNRAEEKEPNNSFSGANAVEIGKPVYGFFNTFDDRDFYYITVADDSILDIELSGVKGINHSIAVWSGSHKPAMVKLVDDNRKSSPEQVLNFRAIPGRYYISIQHGDRDRAASNTENPYKLLIVSREFSGEESEPNDAPDLSTLLNEGEQLNGFYSPSYNRLNSDRDNLHREEDWYRFEVLPDNSDTKVLNAEVTGVQGVDSAMYLYDAAMQPLAESDFNGIGQGEQINGAGIKEPGLYYLMVCAKGYQSNNAIPYGIKYILTQHEPGKEMEPNQAIESANQLTDQVEGVINHPGDIDFYRFDAVSGKRYRLELEAYGSMDYSMEIYNDIGVRVLTVNGSGKGESEIFPNISSSKPFFIKVSSGNYFAGKSEGYVIKCTELERDQSAEIEPNDTKDAAGTLSGDRISGYTSKKGDVDYYIITRPQRARAEFTVKAPPRGKIRLSVTDPLGYVIKSVEVSEGGTSTLSEIIDKKGYLVVRSLKEDYMDPYEISIRWIK